MLYQESIAILSLGKQTWEPPKSTPSDLHSATGSFTSRCVVLAVQRGQGGAAVADGVVLVQVNF